MAQQKRNRNFTDTHVQGALIRRVMMHWCVFFLATTFAMTAIPALGGDPALSYVTRFKSECSNVGFLALIMVVLLPAFMLDTVRFSNRFVGPIGRLRKSLRALSRSEPVEKIQFRESDFWSEMATEFNRVVDMLEADQSTEQSQNLRDVK